jgi:BioD-like phosphotransacetylase family protein
LAILFVLSDKKGSGKTCLVMALLSLLRQQGKSGAYYKPFSAAPEVDPDVAAVSAGFPDLEIPPPASLPAALTPELGHQISARVTALQASCDLVLVEGPDLEDHTSLISALDTHLVAALGARELLLYSYRPGLDEESLFPVCGLFGNRLAGVLLNLVTVHRLGDVHRRLIPALTARNIPVIGAIPEDRVMLAVTVEQIADHLGGRWVQEPGDIGGCVDRFLIGGNIMDSGPSYFGRHSNQAVITRAERPDIQMASFTGDTKCLILTGGAMPTEYIRVEARKHQVPMLLVESDTLSTAEALNGLVERSAPPTTRKVQRFAELVAQHLHQDALLAALS